MILIAGLFACNKNKEDQDQIDKDIIVQYIADHNLDAVEGEQGLYYVVNTPGTGDPCFSNSVVKTTYNGYFTNGESFDGGTIDNFALSNAIAGWQIGMTKFKEGGSGILLIPSSLGYGRTGSAGGSVPGNTVIIFDVDLIKVY
jgi:FKBP-type peptidyl-prolyl cis-trans isomerase